MKNSVKLEVANIHWSDVYKDIARVPQRYRQDYQNQPIPESAICKVICGDRTILLSLRGQTEHNNPAIHIDEITRDALALKVYDNVEFVFIKTGWFGQFRWAWKASDPAYRIVTRLALVSLILGVFGFILGIISIVK